MRKPVILHLIAAVFALGLTADAVRADLTAIVPAYFYPSAGGLASDWADLNTAASRIPVTAIMNPGSGPGTIQNPDYVTAVDNLRAAGGKVIAYVSTSYGNRSSSLVKSDIDKYVNWYNIDGIFFDEMTNSGTTPTLNYYQDIYDYVKAINPTWEVMGNPGTATQESYLTRPVADSLLVHENVGSNYPSYTPSAWNFNYDPSAIGHLVHSEPSQANMLNYLDLAVARNAGQVYVTDDVLNNPWDRLPTYWDAMVDRIEQINNAPPPQPGPFVLSNPVPNGSIVVTGNDRGDWATVPGFEPDAADTAGPEVDYAQVQVAHDDDNFYFRFQLNASNFFNFRHNVFIDVDRDRSTGFTGSTDGLTIGADFLLQGPNVFSFSGATPTTWSWNFVTGMPYDDFPDTDIETLIPRALLGDPSGFDFVVFGDNTGTADYYPNNANSGPGGDLFTYLINNAIEGDLDGDGFVGIADLNIVLGNWNQNVAAGDPSLGDPSGDGFVGIEDLNLVLGNWNAGTAPSGNSHIPEPATISLTVLAAAGLLRRR